MTTRSIGTLQVSVGGLGCNNFGMRIGSDAARAVVDAALDEGITFFDTADVYGSAYGESEQMLGDALAGRREGVVLATKFGSPSHGTTGGAGAAFIRTAVDASLRRLATDRIDLYQLHRFDPSTPVEETVACLHELVTAGKVLEIGLSNCDPTQVASIQAAADALGLSVVSLQNRYNLLEQDDRDVGLAQCAAGGLAYLPYFPLASGMLTGKYRFGDEPPAGTRIAALGNDRVGGVVNERNQHIVDALAGFTAQRGHTVADAAIAWLLADDRIASVIAGATSPEQVRANATGARWVLSAADVAAIDALVAAEPVS
jgi:aryl-alcohol dehydrogenase-like predicted oxidoreductase